MTARAIWIARCSSKTTKCDGMLSLQQFTLSLLTHKGALVEADGDGMTVVAGPALTRALGLSEYQRLVFDPDARKADAALVHYDSPVFDAMGNVVASMGRLAFMSCPAPPSKPIDPGSALMQALTVQNGVARLQGADATVSVYVGFVVEYELLADERTGGLVEVWVNPATRSIARWAGSLFDAPSVADAPAPDDLTATAASAWTLVVPTASAQVLARTREFRESLARRRDRDLHRLRQYYQAIDGEIRRKITRGVSRAGGDIAAERRRLEATANSYRARAADLETRFRLRVCLVPLAAVACALPTYRLRVELKRRTATALAWFSWNPIDRAIEPRCCDGCGCATLVAALCDDRVHYLCGACLGPCPSCGKPFCRACHTRCPRRHE